MYSGSWWIYETAYGRIDINTVVLSASDNEIVIGGHFPCSTGRELYQWGPCVLLWIHGYTLVRLLDWWRIVSSRLVKNSELEPKFHKDKGRVVLRGDTVKDDSGSYAVFPEQGSSASQVTAAKVTDIISRLPLFAVQAADPVSAYIFRWSFNGIWMG